MNPQNQPNPNPKPPNIPADAEDWGYKVISEDRKSIISPDCRNSPCLKVCKDTNPFMFMDFGTILDYPVGQIVTSDFCDCEKECCAGIHYFHSLEAAYAFLFNNTKLIVLCYVPKDGKFVTRKDTFNQLTKSRANRIVTIEPIEEGKPYPPPYPLSCTLTLPISTKITKREKS